MIRNNKDNYFHDDDSECIDSDDDSDYIVPKKNNKDGYGRYINPLDVDWDEENDDNN